MSEQSSPKMLKAKCKRLAERNVCIGRCVFTFDKNGICEHEAVGNSPIAFAQLLQMHGVSELVEAPEVVVPLVKEPKASLVETKNESKPPEPVSSKETRGTSVKQSVPDVKVEATEEKLRKKKRTGDEVAE